MNNNYCPPPIPPVKVIQCLGATGPTGATHTLKSESKEIV